MAALNKTARRTGYGYWWPNAFCLGMANPDMLPLSNLFQARGRRGPYRVPRPQLSTPERPGREELSVTSAIPASVNTYLALIASS